MTDKELNMAILDQLYVIADAVWAKMEKVYEGSFTAAYINAPMPCERTGYCTHLAITATNVFPLTI